jgi:hypothetical protein
MFGVPYLSGIWEEFRTLRNQVYSFYSALKTQKELSVFFSLETSGKTVLLARPGFTR